MDQYKKVGLGLNILFWSTILSTASGFLAAFFELSEAAFLASLLASLTLACSVVRMCGLFLMARTSGRYWTAFTCSVAQLFLWSVSHFAVRLTSMPVLSAAADVLDLLLSLLLVRCVCATTSGLLDSLDSPGAKEVSRQGLEVWKLYLYSSIAMVVCESLLVLLDSSLSHMLVSIPALIAALVGLIASILYLTFLYKSQKLLRQS